MPSREEILAGLLAERTVDIVTVGRRSGRERVTEIWTTPLFGRLFLCGTPNATKPGVVHQPRDWLANLIAEPRFVLRLKRGVEAALPASAERVLDPVMRHRILTAPSTAYYRDRAPSFEAALAHAPMVEVHFVDEATWLTDALARAADDQSDARDRA